jgi:hypothetical protein
MTFQGLRIVAWIWMSCDEPGGHPAPIACRARSAEQAGGEPNTDEEVVTDQLADFSGV